MHRIDPEIFGDRNDQGHDYQDGGEDVHQGADDQQEDVQGGQKEQLALDKLLHEAEDCHGDLGIDHIIGHAQGRAEDHQDAAYQHHAVTHHPGQVAHDFDIAVDEHLHDQHIEGGHRRRFGGGKESAVDAHQDDQREGQFPDRLPGGFEGGLDVERGSGQFLVFHHVDAVDREQHDHQQPRQQAGDKQFVDADLADQPVNDDRQAGGEEHAEIAGRSQQAEGEFVGIIFFQQDRVEQAAQGDDGDAGGAGQGGEDGAGHQGDDRQPAGNPAEEGPGKVDQAGGRLTLRQQVAGEGEEGDRQQDRLAGQAVELDDHHRQFNVGEVKRQQGDGADDRKQRGAEERQQQQDKSEDEGCHDVADPKIRFRRSRIFRKKRNAIRAKPRGMIN